MHVCARACVCTRGHQERLPSRVPCGVTEGGTAFLAARQSRRDPKPQSPLPLLQSPLSPPLDIWLLPPLEQSRCPVKSLSHCGVPTGSAGP